VVLYCWASLILILGNGKKEEIRILKGDEDKVLNKGDSFECE
jgi:hypothetical protein